MFASYLNIPHRYEIVPSRFWKNKITGSTASLYGAVPYTNEADRQNWEIVSNGFVWKDRKTNTYHGQSGQTELQVAERLSRFTNDFAKPVTA